MRFFLLIFFSFFSSSVFAFAQMDGCSPLAINPAGSITKCYSEPQALAQCNAINAQYCKNDGSRIVYRTTSAYWIYFSYIVDHNAIDQGANPDRKWDDVKNLTPTQITDLVNADIAAATAAANAANAGKDGYPPKPDGTCNPPLIVIASGVCGSPPPPPPPDECPPPKFMEGGVCKECLPPKSMQDGVCVEHTCPDGYWYSFATSRCQSNDPCMDRQGQVPSNGLPDRFSCIIKDVSASGSAWCENNFADVYECEGWCVYKFDGGATRFVVASGTSPVPGALMTVYGRFINTGYSCNAGNGTPEDEPAPQVLSSAPPFTFTPSGPSGGVDIPPHCPEGYHNDNSASAKCVADTFTCPVGQHVVAIGTSGTGGLMEACVSNTSPTGSEGLPPAPNGSCVSPLVNVNGVCTQAASTGGIPIVPSCNAPNTLVNGVCTAPAACISPNTLVNGVCTAPLGSSGQPPQSDGTCVSPNTLVNGVCTAPLGSSGQPPQSDGTCISPNTLVNGLCTLLSGTTPTGTGTGTALASGQCGAPGLPICKTDIGDMLRSTANPSDPATRSSSEILGAMNPGAFPLLNGIKSWQLPPHTSSCEFGSFTLKNDYIDKTISFKPICDSFDQHKPIISTAFLWLWTVLPFFLVLRS